MGDLFTVNDKIFNKEIAEHAKNDICSETIKNSSFSCAEYFENVNNIMKDYCNKWGIKY